MSRRAPRALLVGVACLVATGCLAGVFISTAAGYGTARRVAAPAVRSSRRPRPPTGLWEATGRVLRSENLAGQEKGSVLKRGWAFYRSCRRSKCRTVFLRSTLYGRSVTTLKRHGKTFTAVFPPVAVPCLGPNGVTPNRPGRLHDRYTLWWSKDGKRLIAIEHQHGTGGCGLESHAKFHWSARLVQP